MKKIIQKFHFLFQVSTEPELNYGKLYLQIDINCEYKNIG